MNEPTDWLHHDHRRYELLLSQCQSAAEAEDWDAVREFFGELVVQLKAHMMMEEEILYPAYEGEAFAPKGPTTTLRREHEEIVRLLRDLSRVLKTENSRQLLESLPLLEVVMEQHHDKEEQVFLPMAGHILLEKREAIMERIKGFDESKIHRNWGF